MEILSTSRGTRTRTIKVKLVVKAQVVSVENLLDSLETLDMLWRSRFSLKIHFTSSTVRNSNWLMWMRMISGFQLVQSGIVLRWSSSRGIQVMTPRTRRWSSLLFQHWISHSETMTMRMLSSSSNRYLRRINLPTRTQSRLAYFMRKAQAQSHKQPRLKSTWKPWKKMMMMIYLRYWVIKWILITIRTTAALILQTKIGASTAMQNGYSLARGVMKPNALNSYSSTNLTLIIIRQWMIHLSRTARKLTKKKTFKKIFLHINANARKATHLTFRSLSSIRLIRRSPSQLLTKCLIAHSLCLHCLTVLDIGPRSLNVSSNIGRNSRIKRSTSNSSA